MIYCAVLFTRIGAGIIILGVVVAAIEANLHPGGEWGLTFFPFLIFGALVGAIGLVRGR